MTMICKECKQEIEGDFVFMQQHWTGAHPVLYKAFTKWADDDLAVASGGLTQLIQQHGTRRVSDYSNDGADRVRYHRQRGSLKVEKD